jgi:hypothetical protein
VESAKNKRIDGMVISLRDETGFGCERPATDRAYCW